MKIVLLRHGKPEIDLVDRQYERVTAYEIKKIVDDYRWVGLAKQQHIPDQSKRVASECQIFVTSDISRSIESAQLLLNGKDCFKSDSIYREADMPHPMWHWPKLSLKFWSYLLRLCWMLGYQQNGESVKEAKKNAKLGAMQLIDFAQDFDSVMLVGHGINLYFIADELVKLGWTGSANWNKEYWSFNTFIWE